MPANLIRFDDAIEITNNINTLLTIGHSMDNQLVILGEAIGEHHCRIESRNQNYTIKDLHSPSGTFVNGTKIIEAILQEGDVIGIGDFTFKYSEKEPKAFRSTSKNESWNQELKKLAKYSDTDFSILLNGKSGTGKDVLAQEVHRASPRKFGPFVGLNCSAITESLIESELFGHVKGAFSGAIANRKGAFETARGGTLFLDEIGDLPMHLQAKLLRAIENQEIRPVGSDKVVKTDVRILSATHKDLLALIDSGEFRQDLYFRLNVIQVTVPNLVDRMEDFETILGAFCREQRVRFSFAGRESLKAYNWPGNIRELRNFVMRCSAIYPAQDITPLQVEALLPMKKLKNQNINPDSSRNIIKEFEKKLILSRLAANNGNRKKTALELGIPKSTFFDKVRHYQNEEQV